MEGDMLFGTFECRRADYTVRLDIQGGRWGPIEVRGRDEIIVGKDGRFELPRVYDRRLLNLVGWIRGVGDTFTERWESFNAVMTEFEQAFDFTLTDTLTLGEGYTGIESGATLSLNARPVNVAFGSIGSIAQVQVDVELECVDDPPVWVEGSGS